MLLCAVYTIIALCILPCTGSSDSIPVHAVPSKLWQCDSAWISMIIAHVHTYILRMIVIILHVQNRFVSSGIVAVVSVSCCSVVH